MSSRQQTGTAGVIGDEGRRRPMLARAAVATLRHVGGQNLSLAIALGVLVTVIAIQRPNFFLPANLINIGVAVSLLGIVSLAQTVAIVSGGLDISLGPIVGLTSVVAAIGALEGGAAGLLLGIAAGAACGLVNGLLIRYGRVNPIITTLAMYSALQGVTYIVANNRAIAVTSPLFNTIGTDKIAGIPIPLAILIVMALLYFFVLGYTDIGRKIYAIGGNANAARLAGIPVGRYIVGIYIWGGAAAGVAGVILTARSGAGIADSGAPDLALQSITAVLLGGCS